MGGKSSGNRLPRNTKKKADERSRPLTLRLNPDNEFDRWCLQAIAEHRQKQVNLSQLFRIAMAAYYDVPFNPDTVFAPVTDRDVRSMQHKLDEMYAMLQHQQEQWQQGQQYQQQYGQQWQEQWQGQQSVPNYVYQDDQTMLVQPVQPVDYSNAFDVDRFIGTGIVADDE